MTSDESREQKAMLLLEYQEAEQYLAELEEKALRMSYLIDAAAEWLRHFADRNKDISKSEVWVPNARKNIDAKDAGTANALNFKTVIELSKEIAEARGRVSSLQQRKQAIGLK